MKPTKSERQTHREERQLEAVHEHQTEVEEGAQRAEDRRDPRASHETSDRADSGNPVGEVAGGKAAKEAGRQRQQSIPEGGLDRVVHLPLDAKGGDVLSELERRRAQGSDAEGDHELHKKARLCLRNSRVEHSAGEIGSQRSEQANSHAATASAVRTSEESPRTPKRMRSAAPSTPGGKGR